MADKPESLNELRARAVDKGVEGAGRMTRDELVAALEQSPAAEKKVGGTRSGEASGAAAANAQGNATATTTAAAKATRAAAANAQGNATATTTAAAKATRAAAATTAAELSARDDAARGEGESSARPLELGAAGAPEGPPPPAPPPQAARHVQHAPPETATPEFIASERLGELPQTYADGAVVLLARDPRTLFAYWDFSDEQLGQLADGLPDPRAELHLVSHGHAVSRHEVDFRWRSFYLNGVEAGREYRVELYYVGADGSRRRLGRPSNAIPAPPQGPSHVVDDRFVRLSFDEALQAAAHAAMAGPPVEVDGADLRRLPGAPPLGSSEGGALSGRVPGGRS